MRIFRVPCLVSIIEVTYIYMSHFAGLTEDRAR